MAGQVGRAGLDGEIKSGEVIANMAVKDLQRRTDGPCPAGDDRSLARSFFGCACGKTCAVDNALVMRKHLCEEEHDHCDDYRSHDVGRRVGKNSAPRSDITGRVME